jgi:hypothetical protein
MGGETDSWHKTVGLQKAPASESGRYKGVNKGIFALAGCR